MPDYDIEGAFRAIENELLDSMIRNLKHHRAEETKEGFEWTSWQTEQLKALNKYKAKNGKKFKKHFSEINSKIEEGIRKSKKLGSMNEEISILEAIKKGFKTHKASSTMQAQFFRLNERKLDALIKATTSDMQKAESAMLRMANDQYRKFIFNAQVYANTGAGTYEKAVDMATRDYLSRGINCIEYKNGARVNIASYAAMAIRTANTRAYLQGEGEKRQEWGISTVIVNKRGHACLKCLKWTGKVLIDDVWSGGKATDGPYPLMSTAMAQGLYHPNCKDGHTTFFPDISEEPESLTREDVNESVEATKREQRQQYAQRQAERFDRLAEYSLDEDNQRRYGLKADEWNQRLEKFNNLGLVTADSSKQNYIDVTNEWLKNATPNSHKVSDLLEYEVDNVLYKVDGKHVVLDYNKNEKQIANLLKNTFGGKVEMVPRIVFPQGLSTPDYLWDGIPYDLKSPKGSGKEVLYGMLKKKKKQSNNFIFDVSNCPLDLKEIYQQIDGIYKSSHTKFVKNLIVIKDGEIKKVFQRKK